MPDCHDAQAIDCLIGMRKDEWNNDIWGLLFDVALSLLIMAFLLGSLLCQMPPPSVMAPYDAPVHACVHECVYGRCVSYGVEYSDAQHLTSSRIFMIYTLSVCAAFAYGTALDKVQHRDLYLVLSRCCTATCCFTQHCLLGHRILHGH